jgi:hypothetical protein
MFTAVTAELLGWLVWVLRCHHTSGRSAGRRVVPQAYKARYAFAWGKSGRGARRQRANHQDLVMTSHLPGGEPGSVAKAWEGSAGAGRAPDRRARRGRWLL